MQNTVRFAPLFSRFAHDVRIADQSDAVSAPLSSTLNPAASYFVTPPKLKKG